jgi:hypothetical protein
MLRYYQMADGAGFWILWLDCSVLIILVYLGKFVLLKSIGWVFNISRATDTYLFVIFLVNKVLGIFLLPFLLVLSFSGPVVREIAVTASWLMLAIFLLYRFLAAFGPIQKEIKVRGVHFLLYLCAFELAPLLLIYKVLLSYLQKAY